MKWVTCLAILLLGAQSGYGLGKASSANAIPSDSGKVEIPRQAVSRHWAGAYSLSVVYGELDEFSKMGIYYYFNIRENTASVTAEGYRTSFECKCTLKEGKDRLVLLYKQTVESLTDVPVKNEGDTVAILTREQNNYYVQSPVIADTDWNYNTRLPLTKETSD